MSKKKPMKLPQKEVDEILHSPIWISLIVFGVLFSEIKDRIKRLFK